ncbi:MAG: RluA family pseudouridine synthase [Clostridia bacterium]|nr:RluA family pseudouridine synthase [Clostridia bacterium]
MKFKATQSSNLIKTIIHNIQGLSFSSAQKAMRLGNIKVNGKRTKQNIQINIGDEIDIYEIKKSKPNIPIVYEDENIIIINKPAGIECATRDKSSENTYSLEEIFEDKNAIVVHRLDRLTEGLVILARNKNIAKLFEEIFRTRQVQKKYLAGVYHIPQSEGVKTAYLLKNSKTALVTISDTPKENYKEIITEFYIQNKLKDYAIIDITLHTGRTHQIRGYFAHIGNPIIGDDKYGRNSKNTPLKTSYKGYHLTAYKLAFNIKHKDLEYLNKLEFEITPSWKQSLLENTNN